MAPRKKKAGEGAAEPAVESAPARRTRAQNSRTGAEEAEVLEPEDTLLEPDEVEEPGEVGELGEPGEVEAAIIPSVRRDFLGADPLASYMSEVRRHPLLTREEEYALARRYRATGDVKAAYQLVAANLRLVVKLANEYHRNPLSLLDLVQEGNIGLMQAVKKFDPERGVKLSTYAAWWIRAYILRYIMDNWKMVKLGTTEAQRKLFFKLRQEQDRLAKQGVEANPKLLAERLDVTEQDVIEMDVRLGNDELSLDAPMSEDSKATRLDRMLPAGGTSVDDQLANEELKQLFREKVAEFAQSLSEKERTIFEKRLMSDEPMTLQQIGDAYGFSRERARQIEAALISRMRDYMREHIPDFDLVAAPRD